MDFEGLDFEKTTLVRFCLWETSVIIAIELFKHGVRGNYFPTCHMSSYLLSCPSFFTVGVLENPVPLNSLTAGGHCPIVIGR
jgi:hypothetical protein